MSLLTVRDLKTYFHTRHGVVRAVDGVSFHVEPGETLGIVGESGSGKSVTCYSLLGLISMPPGRIEDGAAQFGYTNLLECEEDELRRIRGRQISMIFQDPMTALNPYMTIGEQVVEPLLVHELCSRCDARTRAAAMLKSVGLQEAHLRAYPHQLSGGQRQRVMIAMSLITHPDLLIADEPTTALDVTVQAQILALLKRLQQELEMAVILITHNLSVIEGICDRVLVMYAGRIMESAPATTLFNHPRHPYTSALMASMPGLAPKGTDLYTIPGTPPDLSKEIFGCPFAPRCKHATYACLQERPELRPIGPRHETACLRVQTGEL